MSSLRASHKQVIQDLGLRLSFVSMDYQKCLSVGQKEDVCFSSAKKHLEELDRVKDTYFLYWA